MLESQSYRPRAPRAVFDVGFVGGVDRRRRNFPFFVT